MVNGLEFPTNCSNRTNGNLGRNPQLGSIFGKIPSHDTYDWRECTITVNGGFFSGYTLKPGTMQVGRTFLFQFRDFTDLDGLRFNPNSRKVQKLTVFCYDPKGELVGSGVMTNR